jgi:hypothetical protein
MTASGMIVGTLFTLFVVPSIYVLLARRHAGLSRQPIGNDVPLPAQKT